MVADTAYHGATHHSSPFRRKVFAMIRCTTIAIPLQSGLKWAPFGPDYSRSKAQTRPSTAK